MKQFTNFYNSDAPAIIAAIILWLIGAYNTNTFFVTLMPEFPIWGTFILQFALTALQRNLYTSKGNKAVSAIALFFDTITNVGGTYFILQNITLTDSWKAVQDAFSVTDPSLTVLFIASILMGMFIAVAPELTLRHGTTTGRG